jgi:hypothetical protein
MIDAAKRKNGLPISVVVARLWLLLIVALCLPETRVWGFEITAPPASSVFESVTRSAVGENYVDSAYDASDSLHAAKTTAVNMTDDAVRFHHPYPNDYCPI